MIALPQGQGRQRHVWSVAADLTPLIDVLFMLLIFMVLTANSAQVALNGAVPSTQETGLQSPEPGQKVRLRIQQGEIPYVVEGQEANDWATARAILEDLLDRDGRTGFSVMVDPDVSVQRLVDVMAYSQAKGMSEADILLEMR